MASSSPKKSSQPAKKKARKSKVESEEEESEAEATSGQDSDVKPKAKGKKKASSSSSKAKAVPKKESKEEKSKKNGKVESDVKVKKGKRKVKEESDDEGGDDYKDGADEGEDSAEFEEDSEEDDRNTRVVREVKKVPAPKANADTSVILKSTMDFLAELRKNNDREWFEENKARYTHALTNFKAFIAAWVPKASQADWQLPELPTKDLIQRIYRDVRFSKDKTPYRSHMAFNHSRTGRKGIFAFYYIQIGPGGGSLLAAGCWQPQTEQLKSIRQAILRDPQQLRDAISEKEFVKLYGKPEPRKDGGRQSIFGLSDQLKNSPKLEGVDKNHKDIDLLKCRSIAVETRFTDEQVLADDFLDQIIKKMEVTAPFVQLLNEFISPSPESEDEEGGDDGASGSGGGEQEEEEEE